MTNEDDRQDESQGQPYGVKWRSRPLFIITTVGLGMFTDLFLYTLLVPVFPFLLEDRMNISPDQIQEYTSMLLALYAGASALSSPMIGFISDKIANTRQLPFMLGLLALLGGTFLIAVGQSVYVLAIARLLQGASSGIVWTIGLAMLVETVGANKLGLVIGSIFSFLSVGTLIGPVAGGVLYEKTGYKGVFGLSSAILVLDLILRALLIERRKAAKYFDWETENNVKYSSEDSNSDEESGENQTSEQTPLLTNESQRNTEEKLAAYVLGDTRNYIGRQIPVMRTLRSPSLIMALLLSMSQALLLGAFDATVPTLAKTYYGFNSLSAGLMFLPLAVTDLAMGPAGGWATDRYGTKFTSVAGYAYLAPILFLYRLATPGGTAQIVVYAVLLALGGVGIAVVGAPAIVEAGAEMERYDKANPNLFGKNGPYAQMYGLTSMLFSLGLTIGPIMAGWLKDAIGYGNMNAILAAGCVIMATLSFLYVGGRLKLPIKRSA